MQQRCSGAGVVLIVPIFEREAAGVYRNSAAIVDADGRCSARTGRCTSPTIRSSTRNTTSRRATRHLNTRRSSGCEWLPCLENELRDDRRAHLLGPVVSRRPRASRRCLAPRFCSIPTAIGWHPAEKDDWPGAGRRVAHVAARARDRERRFRCRAESCRQRGRGGHRRYRVLRTLVHLRSVWTHARGGRRPIRHVLVAECDPAADRRHASQLAVPARPPHRRIRADSQPIPG